MSEMCILKRSISEKDREVHNANSKRCELQKQCTRYLQDTEQLISKNLNHFESIFQTRLAKLNADMYKLIKDTEVLKEKEYLRRSSTVRLNETLKEAKLELNQSQKMVEELQAKFQNSSEAKSKAEQQIYELKAELSRKIDEISGMEGKIVRIDF